jgi:hypothetical protein
MGRDCRFLGKSRTLNEAVLRRTEIKYLAPLFHAEIRIKTW